MPFDTVGSPTARTITAPFFEIGPKNLLRLPQIIDVAAAAARSGAQHRVQVIVTVPIALITAVRAAVPDILVFAQALDTDEPGPSVGTVTAEALADAGADGVMLGHDARPLTPAAMRRSIERARDLGLMTMVCAGTDDEVLSLLGSNPTIVLYEPPQLIGGAGGGIRPWIAGIDDQVRRSHPQVLMMHAGGVSVPDDAFQIMRSGAAGTGSTSGVLRAVDPTLAADQFIAATRAGFDTAR